MNPWGVKNRVLILRLTLGGGSRLSDAEPWEVEIYTVEIDFPEGRFDFADGVPRGGTFLAPFRG